MYGATKTSTSSPGGPACGSQTTGVMPSIGPTSSSQVRSGKETVTMLAIVGVGLAGFEAPTRNVGPEAPGGLRT